jgi:hypothetical protein
MHCACVVELHVTVKNIKILSVAQQCFCAKFMSPATLKRTYVFIRSARCCSETRECSFTQWPSLDVQSG